LVPKPEADIFGETADEIRADEELWDQEYAASRDQLRTMAREAAAEYRAGRTKPMEFTPERENTLTHFSQIQFCCFAK